MIFLSKETQVETQYVKFKVTQDTMATFFCNLVFAHINPFKMLERMRNIHDSAV